MGISKRVVGVAGWTFRWGLEILIALVIAGLLAAALFGGGCTIKEPIDTDGDGRADTQMSAAEIEAWQRRDEAKAKAAADRVKAEAEARIAQRNAALEEAARIKRDAEREMRRAHARAENDAEDIAADAEDQIAHLNAQVDAAIQTIRADASASIAKLAEDLQVRSDARESALASLETKAGIFDAVLNNPTLKTAAGSIPFGGEILTAIGGLGALVFGHRAGKKSGMQQGSQAGENKGWDDGYAAGLSVGKQQGVSEGRDIGWQERADHQKELDMNHAEGLAFSLAAAAAKAPGVAA